MVQLQILAEDQHQAEEIAEFLLKKKLVLDVYLSQSMPFLSADNGQLISAQKVLLTAKTKSLLFKDIDLKIKKKYPSKMPLIWSLAITHMDWDQAEFLIKNTASI